MGGAAALDQPAARVDLVGAVDRQVETGDGIEGDQRQAVLLCCGRGRR
ncbi:MAG TPA: hypothetical protein VGJ70_19475 [Solirubrobacteraceae bacterium]